MILSLKIIRAVTVSMSTCFYEGIVSDLQERGYEVVSVSSPGPELEGLRTRGVRCIEISMERHISLLKDIKSLLRLIRTFHAEKPDMVHSMTPKAGLLCMIAACVCRVPRRVHTFTGLVWPTESGLKRKVLMLTDRITCMCATHIIPEGHGVMSDLQASITKKPMKVLGYGNVRGVDMDRFSRRKEVDKIAEKIKDNRFTFLFVGRIVGDKGINELVSAFSRLHEKIRDTRLWLVGRYESELDPLKPETVSEIENNAAIETLGPKYDDELVAYYLASDCFVFPSYREGFPNTVLEAGAMGLPCIVTDINGSREIIKDGNNGLVIPSKDDVALYNAMETVILNSGLREQLVSNARPMIASRYEQGFVRKCLLDFYDDVLK